jgi:hypothetical protein
MLYISPTFLDSFRRYMDMDSGEASDAVRQELLDRLRGVRRPPNEAMQRGTDFETDVCAACDMKYTPKGSDYDMYVKEIADFVRGARRQVHVEAEIIPGITIHGYIDFLLPGLIVDTKTTFNYEWGKYLHNTQHLAYLYALKPEGITRFEYVVTDFKGIYHERYDWTSAFEAHLKSRVWLWMDYIDDDAEMKEAFLTHKTKREVNHDSVGV